MFGRLLRITIYNENNEGIIVVDTKERKYNDYICDGTINRYPGSEKDLLTLNIYNLNSVIRGEIGVGTYTRVKVEFGYEDEDGILSTLFDGQIIRPQFTRVDGATDKATIYAYDSGNFKMYGFFSKTYLDGTNYYDIAQDIARNGNVPISYALSEKLKNYVVNGSESFYGSQDELLSNIASKCGLSYKTENDVARIFGNDDSLEDVVVFSNILDNGKVVSQSGLIGIPTLREDGLYLQCLINPKLRIYSHIQVLGSIISISQNGAVPNAQAGGQLNDATGIYKVTKLTINFNNTGNESYMDITAVSTDIYGGI